MKTTNIRTKLPTFMVIFVLNCLSLSRAGEIEIRVLENWDEPTMGMEDVVKISKASVALIDAENMVNNPEMLRFIKQMNPKIILIAKINLTEIVLPTINRPIQVKLIEEMGNLENEFLLRDSAGRRVVAPREGGGYIFNISADCPPPQKNNFNYNQFAANFFIKNVFFADVWDGVYVNNSWQSIYFLVAGGTDVCEIDTDKNHKGDKKNYFIMAWQKGFNDFIDQILQTQKEGFIPFNRIKFSENTAKTLASF